MNVLLFVSYFVTLPHVSKLYGNWQSKISQQFNPNLISSLLSKSCSSSVRLKSKVFELAGKNHFYREQQPGWILLGSPPPSKSPTFLKSLVQFTLILDKDFESQEESVYYKQSSRHANNGVSRYPSYQKIFQLAENFYKIHFILQKLHRES